MPVRLLTVLLALALTSCANFSQQLQSTTIISPTPAETQQVRELAQRYFTCPAGTRQVYVVGRVDLATNATTVGVRCQ